MFKTVEVGLLNNNVSIMIFLIYVSQHLHYLHVSQNCDSYYYECTGKLWT